MMSSGPAMFADAEAYERFMGRWSRRLAPLLVESAGLAGDGPALDAGSGTGSLAFALAAANPARQVIGVDASEQYVAFAARGNRFGDRVQFETGDLRALRFADGSFDGALSMLVLNFVSGAEAAVRELARVTRPGGRVAAAVWDYGSGMRMLRTFWDAAASVNPSALERDEGRMPLCRRGELEALFRGAGLERVEDKPLEITMRFESFADFWDPFLLGQGPAGAYVRRLDASQAVALREEVRRRLALAADGDAFELTARAWAARGEPARRS